MKRKNNLIGQKFNRLLVIGSSTEMKVGRNYPWICSCDCGNRVEVLGYNLKTGKTKSCGCFRTEQLKEKGKSWRAKPEGVSVINVLITRYKRGAEKRNLNFNLSREKFIDLVSSECYYCGVKPFLFYKPKGCRSGIVYNGIDRLDNKKDYIEDNCVSCCKNCNYAKGSFSLKEWTEYIERLVSFNIKKGKDGKGS